MLTELNKIFDRDFVIGQFIPALVFVTASIGLLFGFGALPPWLHIKADDLLKDTTLVALISLVVALSLMALNRAIFRLLEGYWVFHLGRLLNYFQRWRFRRLHRRLHLLLEEKNRCRDQVFPHAAELQELKLRSVNHFPSREDLLLPTSFGNTVRSFEEYPLLMYGIESITGWSRLHAVVPKDYRQILSGMRSSMDFWMNLWFLSFVVSGEYLYLAARIGDLHYPWVLLALVVFAFLTSWQSRVAAEQWGEWVKGAFDVFLPALCKELGYLRPQDSEDERAFWIKFSQAITYRNPPSLDKLKPFRSNPVFSATTSLATPAASGPAVPATSTPATPLTEGKRDITE